MSRDGEFLLDTNIVSAFFQNDADISQRIRAASRVFLSSTVVGELILGALGSRNSIENLARVESLARSCVVLSCDESTAVIYANFKFALRRSGRAIPDNDIWIAAVASQHGLCLATRDHHFQMIEGISLEYW